MTDRNIASKIIKAIEDDLLDRRGLKHELRETDPRIRVEIRQAWRVGILKILEGRKK